MDIRPEVLELNRVWSVTDGSLKLTPFSSEKAALAAGVRAALKHHQETGGTATVHLWRGAQETVVFDTRTDDDNLVPRDPTRHECPQSEAGHNSPEGRGSRELRPARRQLANFFR